MSNILTKINKLRLNNDVAYRKLKEKKKTMCIYI